jgi:hypothetical protein
VIGHLTTPSRATIRNAATARTGHIAALPRSSGRTIDAVAALLPWRRHVACR